MTQKAGRKPRRWRGYAALAGPDGSLVWGSFRPSEAEARRYFENQNPLCRAVVVSVRIEVAEEGPPPHRPEEDEE